MFLSRVALTLLPVVAGAWGSHFHTSELIQRVYSEGDSKAAYFIGDEGELIASFMKRDTDVPVMTTASGGAGERINDLVILVVQEKNDSQAFMEILERIINRLRVRKYVVISARTKEHLHQVCPYFAKQKFMRIFGVVRESAFAFLTYSGELLPIIPSKDPLPDAQRDLNGYSIRTTAHKDIPRVFHYPDSKGRLQIGGFYGQMLLSFFKKHNASFEEVPVTNSSTMDVPAIWKAIEDDRVDVSMNSYAVLEKGYFVSYPVLMLGWTVMIPRNGYLDPNEYFLRPFSLAVWLCIGGTFLYIILMDVGKDLAKGQRPNPWRCFSQTLLMMLNMSSTGLIGNAGRIHIMVLLYAFVLVNLYLNHLTSYLTVSIRIKQLDTLQELIDNKVHFQVPNFIWKHAVATRALPPKLETIAHPVEYSTFALHLTKMQNTSIAYALVRDKGEFLIDLQSHTGNPLFRLIAEYIGMVHTGFMMHPHSPFSEILTYFIMRSRETGLMEKWNRETVRQALRSGFRVAKGEKDEESGRPLSWNDLRFAWTSFTVGVVVALLVFLGETLAGFLGATSGRTRVGA